MVLINVDKKERKEHKNWSFSRQAYLQNLVDIICFVGVENLLRYTDSGQVGQLK